VCILSAHGSLGMVALHQPGKIATYEVVFFTSFYIEKNILIVLCIFNNGQMSNIFGLNFGLNTFDILHLFAYIFRVHF
jgi:hypothetical protein